MTNPLPLPIVFLPILLLIRTVASFRRRRTSCSSGGPARSGVAAGVGVRGGGAAGLPDPKAFTATFVDAVGATAAGTSEAGGTRSAGGTAGAARDGRDRAFAPGRWPGAAPDRQERARSASEQDDGQSADAQSAKSTTRLFAGLDGAGDRRRRRDAGRGRHPAMGRCRGRCVAVRAAGAEPAAASPPILWTNPHLGQRIRATSASSGIAPLA